MKDRMTAAFKRKTLLKRMTAILTSIMMAFSMIPAGIPVYASDSRAEDTDRRAEQEALSEISEEDTEEWNTISAFGTDEDELPQWEEESEEPPAEESDESLRDASQSLRDGTQSLRDGTQSLQDATQSDWESAENSRSSASDKEESTDREEETEQEESGALDPIVWVNPDRKAYVNEEDLIEEVKEKEKEEDESPIATYSASSNFLPFSECAEDLRAHLVARDTEFTLYYEYTGSVMSNAVISTQLTLLFNSALAHTGNGDEGDYIAKHIDEWASSVRYSGSSGAYKVTFKPIVEYYTTASQEASVTKKVDQALDSILYPCMSDYEKVKAIYDYIIQNVSYDYDHLNDESYTMHFTAYAALINGKAVCQGFANLFYRMALDAGLDCRIVTGIASGEAHAWNIVKVGDSYYNVDATWDSNKATYTWFLKGTGFSNHTADSSFSTTSWTKQYPVASSDYNVSTATSGNTSNHTYTSKVTKEATCSEDGVKTYTCSVCGTSYTEKISASGGHNLVHIAAVAAGDAHTDTEGNIEYYKCSICGKCFTDSAGKNEISESDTITYPEGHTVRHVKASSATCVEDGNKEYWYCEDCKLYYSNSGLTQVVSLSDMILPATGHTLVYAAAKEATCDKDGNVAYYKCSVCGAVFSDEDGTQALSATVIPAKGHTTAHTEAKNPTTEEEGTREYWYCAECDTYFYDENCAEPGSAEDMILPVVEHPINLTVSISWQDHDEDAIPEEWIPDPLMIELAATTKDLEHRYEFIPVEFTAASGWTYTFTDVYDDVYYSITDTEGIYQFYYDYDEEAHYLSVTGVLTVDVEFVWNEDCTECAAYFMDPLGNILAEVKCGVTSVRILDPTCTEEGAIRHTAAADYFGNEILVYEDHDGFEHNAGTSYFMDAEETTIPALGHTPGTHVEAKAATEDEDGNVEYWICEVCGAFTDAEGNEIDDITTTWASLSGTILQGQDAAQSAQDEDAEDTEGGNVSGHSSQYKDVNPEIGEDEGDPDVDISDSNDTNSNAENAEEDEDDPNKTTESEDASSDTEDASDEDTESADEDSSNSASLILNSGTDSDTTATTATSVSRSLQTGVESHLGLIIGVAVVAVILLAAALILRKKSKN